MKRYSIIFIFLLVISGCELESLNSENANNYPQVKGKKFISQPTGLTSYPGCEGCGNRGSFEFYSEDNDVHYLWPGSDIIECGKYTQTGFKIEINSDMTDNFSLTMSEDGLERIDDEYGIIFRDENYPWDLE